MAYKTTVPCVCIPSAGFTCKACAARQSGGPEDFELQGDDLDTEPDLTGYGYRRADQDGYDGGEVSPAEHKSEEFEEAARQMLNAKEI